jgi:hypothetical protein
LRVLRLAQQLAGGARHADAAAVKIGFDHLDALAIANEFCGDLDRRQRRQAEHVHRQPRRHEIVGAVALFDRKSQ